MPRFYFDLYDTSGYVEDKEGAELADLAEAKRMAIKSARSIICDDVESGHLNLDGRIEVLDGARNGILTIGFRYASGLKPDLT